MNEMENGSGKNGTKAASEGTIAHKRRMVSGAKFGLTVFFLDASNESGDSDEDR